MMPMSKGKITGKMNTENQSTLGPDERVTVRQLIESIVNGSTTALSQLGSPSN